jgi:hypothetical protein
MGTSQVGDGWTMLSFEWASTGKDQAALALPFPSLSAFLRLKPHNENGSRPPPGRTLAWITHGLDRRARGGLMSAFILSI